MRSFCLVFRSRNSIIAHCSIVFIVYLLQGLQYSMSFYRISLLLFIFAHLLTTCSLHLSRLPSHSVQDSFATSQYSHLNTIPLASVLRRRFLAHHNSRSHISFLCFILLSGDIETNPVQSHLISICALLTFSP